MPSTHCCKELKNLIEVHSSLSFHGRLVSGLQGLTKFTNDAGEVGGLVGKEAAIPARGTEFKSQHMKMGGVTLTPTHMVKFTPTLTCIKKINKI